MDPSLNVLLHNLHANILDPKIERLKINSPNPDDIRDAIDKIDDILGRYPNLRTLIRLMK